MSLCTTDSQSESALATPMSTTYTREDTEILGHIPHYVLRIQFIRCKIEEAIAASGYFSTVQLQMAPSLRIFHAEACTLPRIQGLQLVNLASCSQLQHVAITRCKLSHVCISLHPDTRLHTLDLRHNRFSNTIDLRGLTPIHAQRCYIAGCPLLPLDESTGLPDSGALQRVRVQLKDFAPHIDMLDGTPCRAKAPRRVEAPPMPSTPTAQFTSRTALPRVALLRASPGTGTREQLADAPTAPALSPPASSAAVATQRARMAMLSSGGRSTDSAPRLRRASPAERNPPSAGRPVAADAGRDSWTRATIEYTGCGTIFVPSPSASSPSKRAEPPRAASDTLKARASPKPGERPASPVSNPPSHPTAATSSANMWLQDALATIDAVKQLLSVQVREPAIAILQGAQLFAGGRVVTTLPAYAQAGSPTLQARFQAEARVLAASVDAM